jgi:hypothetical protein
MPTPAVKLSDVEREVLNRLKPPLNIQKVSHQWTKQVKQARRLMAADCALTREAGTGVRPMPGGQRATRAVYCGQ